MTESDSPSGTGVPDGVLALAGDWTVIRAAEMRPLLAQSLEEGVTRLDLSRITEFDSAGLQLLLSVRRSAAARGIELAFDAPSAAVRDLADVYHLDADLQSPRSDPRSAGARP